MWATRASHQGMLPRTSPSRIPQRLARERSIFHTNFINPKSVTSLLLGPSTHLALPYQFSIALCQFISPSPCTIS